MTMKTSSKRNLSNSRASLVSTTNRKKVGGSVKDLSSSQSKSHWTSKSESSLSVKDKVDYEALSNAVYEFMQFANFDKTAATFSSECQQRKIRISSSKGPLLSTEQVNKLKENLSQGRFDDFFESWTLTFPRPTQNRNTKILEFYLRLYFATYSLRGEKKGSIESSMKKLKNYLEKGGGADLSETPELVPFFALPYVSQPAKHPTFKDLTQDKWAKQIEQRLEDYLSKHLDSQQKQPKLLKMFQGEDDLSNRSNKKSKTPAFETAKEGELSRQLETSEKNVAALKKQCNQLHQDYHNLIGIAAELVEALEQTVKGQSISSEYFEEISTKFLESNDQLQRRFSEKLLSAVGGRSEPALNGGETPSVLENHQPSRGDKNKDRSTSSDKSNDGEHKTTFRS